MTDPPHTGPTPGVETVRALLAMQGIEAGLDDPRLAVLVSEVAIQLGFARLIDDALAATPAEAVAGAVGTFDPAWPTTGDQERAS